MRRTAAIAIALWAAATGCKSSGSAPEASSPCREGPEDDVAMGAKTGVAGAKTGLKTGLEGVKALGGAGVGLVEGGSSEAKTRWKEGKQETRQTANEGAAETRRKGSTPRCK
jgi:hypothetical protein